MGTDAGRRDGSEGVFEATVCEGVLRLRRPGTTWLSTGHAGGRHEGPAAYNVTVPEGWPETDLDAYVADRRERAGFTEAGPALLTGVAQRHARRARLDGVEAVVTAGLSNPAALALPDGSDPSPDAPETDDARPGTVNVFVGTERALPAGALANLLTVAAEAKAATLTERLGFTGTTSDAVVVACDPAGDPSAFSGSATAIGRAARACTRDALLASLEARYADGEAAPTSVADADYGVVTRGDPEVAPVE
jgi:adenosylcobinamide hydrolase